VALEENGDDKLVKESHKRRDTEESEKKVLILVLKCRW
jgi:hypothetical protein